MTHHGGQVDGYSAESRARQGCGGALGVRGGRQVQRTQDRPRPQTAVPTCPRVPPSAIRHAYHAVPYLVVVDGADGVDGPLQPAHAAGLLAGDEALGGGRWAVGGEWVVGRSYWCKSISWGGGAGKGVSSQHVGG